MTGTWWFGVSARSTGQERPVGVAADVSNSFTPVGNMVSPHTNHAMTLLHDGRVLVSGKDGTEIYDPIAQSFESIGPGTGNHAVLMQDGKVLIVAESADSIAEPGPHVFDPLTNSITALGASLAHPRTWFTLTAVSSGPGLRQWMRIDPFAVLLSPQIYSDLNRPDPPPFATLLQAARPVIEQMSSDERILAMKQLRQLAELLKHFEKELSSGQLDDSPYHGESEASGGAAAFKLSAGPRGISGPERSVIR